MSVQKVQVAKVRGFEDTSQAFQRELVRVALHRRIDPSVLAAVISFETGASFSASVENPRSGAVGLLQFTSVGISALNKRFGTSYTKRVLSEMSDVEQLAVVEQWYEMTMPRGGGVEDAYLAVLAPAFVGALPDTPVFAEPSQSYTQNRELDRDRDGVITADEATRPVRELLQAGFDDGFIEVDFTAPVVDLGAVLFFVFLGLGALVARRMWKRV